MRKIFKKVLAGVMTTAMVATVFVGIGTSSVNADDTVTLTPWNFYEGAASFRNDKDPYAQRFYKSVTVGDQVIEGWGSAEAGTQEMTQRAKAPSDNFIADIVTTGWDGDYTVTPTGNNPYLLRAYMEGIKIKTGHDYTISFDAKWTRGNDNGAEKNVTIGVANSDESVFANDPTAVTKIKIGNGETVNYSQKFTVWSGDGTISVELAYGCHLKDINDGITTEKTSAAGQLAITNVKIVDEGQNPNYVAPPERETTTENPGGNTTVKPGGDTTVKPGGDTTVKPTTSTKKFAKVKKLKAKNNKKGTIKITWKKVAKAKKYTVKVGKKTYTAKKANLTVKKLKKGKKYTVKVRAKAVAGYKAGAWAKTTVKIKK